MNNATLKIRLKLKKNFKIMDWYIDENFDYVPSGNLEYDRLEKDCQVMSREWKRIDPIEYVEYLNTEKLIIF